MMDTRRSRRGGTEASDFSKNQRTIRSTRQIPEASSRVTRQTQRNQEALIANPRGLVHDPKPRRNAPPDTASLASVATMPMRLDDETEFGDGFTDDIVAEPITQSLEGGEEPSYQSQDAQDGQIRVETDRETKQRILELTIPDLGRAAADLMEFISGERSDPEESLFRGRLKIKRATFRVLREEYEEEDSKLFIDWARFIDCANVHTTDEERTAISEVITGANIVSVLDMFVDIRKGNEPDAPYLLEQLNNHLPALNTNDTSMTNSHILEVRTWLLILQLERSQDKTDYKALIASIFCDDPGNTRYAQLFSHGPFKHLGRVEDPQETEELCSERITELVQIIRRNKGADLIDQLKEQFPFENMRTQVKHELLRFYDGLTVGKSTPPQQQAIPGLDNWDSQVSDTQSQPIVRDNAADKRQSLFQGKGSLDALHATGYARGPVPASNQWHAAPPSTAPQDYPDHSNGDLLNTPMPPSRELRLGNRNDEESPYARQRPPRQRRADTIEHIEEEDAFETGIRPVETNKRTRDDDIVEQDEEEDHFETDTRPVNTKKQAQPAAEDRSAKRPRVADPDAMRMPPPVRPSASQTPIATTPLPNPRSSQPDFAAIKQVKDHVALQARLQAFPSSRQRHTWSDDDCAVLIELIRKHHAAWSAMELDSHRFQRPRNQQGYRDKARNIKVDLLMADAVLPPCFDLVALGKKECDKLISFGKNPYRRENELDEDGNPIATEYEPRVVS